MNMTHTAGISFLDGTLGRKVNVYTENLGTLLMVASLLYQDVGITYAYYVVTSCNVTMNSASVYLSSVYAKNSSINCDSNQLDSWQRIE